MHVVERVQHDDHSSHMNDHEGEPTDLLLTSKALPPPPPLLEKQEV